MLWERGYHGEARAHLDLALSLADACRAPYERALTLLARATLDQTTGNAAAAHCALAEVRAICEALGADPTSAHAIALMATLTSD